MKTPKELLKDDPELKYFVAGNFVATEYVQMGIKVVYYVAKEMEDIDISLPLVEVTENDFMEKVNLMSKSIAKGPEERFAEVLRINDGPVYNSSVITRATYNHSCAVLEAECYDEF